MLKVDKKKCTGCSLCKIKCPKKCIEMISNEEGFLYPVVTNKLDCIDCNICNQCCPCNKTIKANNKKYYALQLKNDNMLKKCASGGAFTALALSVISLNGKICGVSQIENELKFTIIDKEEDISLISGSKYFQCNLSSEIYDEINELNSNDYFLFSGTPCQVAAIESKFRKKFKNKLLTVEIICQGVPSYKVVKKSYNELEKRVGSKIMEHKFRSKDYFVGRNYLNKYLFSNGTIKYFKGSEDILTKSFQNQIFLRESCYNCNYTQNNRVADFTIGDLWEYSLKNKNIDLKKGVSVIITNSITSQKFIKNIYTYVNIEEINEDCVKHNVPFNRSVKRPFSRSFSYKLLRLGFSFKGTVNICCIKYNFKQLVKKIIRKDK